MAPPQRRAEPNTVRLPPTSPSSRRPQMYNLAGHALSSGSLLPRSTENVGVSVGAYNGSHPHLPAAPPAGVASGVGVPATDAPYLTNLESHFGRVTLTAPDNMRRKQAKEKKQKIRQRKAQTAQVAAAALAGFDPPSSSTPAASSGPLTSSRTFAAASTSNLLDPDRRYQATIDDGVTSTGLLAAPAQPGMRRAYSGNQTATLTSIAHSQPSSAAVQSSTSVGTRRVRRRRASTTRGDEASRPASRASAPSRPDSSLSYHQDNNSAAAVSRPATSMSSRSRNASDNRPARSRSDSAPAAQEVELVPSSTSQAAQQSSLHRQNVWNDIVELDPNDLPPPFPENAPRPPDPPLPPPHSSVSQDQQLIGPQPHARIPDSPPPPFRSDPESEADDVAEPRIATGSASPASSRRRSQRRQASSSSTRRQSSLSHAASRSDSPLSESSAGELGSEEVAEERRAWEADIRNGLSFEVRLLREQQRRVARERAASLLDVRRPSPLLSSGALQHSEASIESEEVQQDQSTRGYTQQPSTALSLPAHARESLSEDEGEQADDETDATGPNTALEEVSDTEEIILAQETAPVASTPSARPTISEQALSASEPNIESSSMLQTQQTTQAPTALVEPSTVLAARPTSTESQEPTFTLRPSIQAAAAPATSIIEIASATRSKPGLATPAQRPSRSALHNETRLGLPSLGSTRPVSASIARPSSSRIAHRKTNSDIRSPGLAAGRRSDLGRVASQGSRPVSAASSMRTRLLAEGSRARGHDSDSNLPISGRPEDTLFVISAPPPAVRLTSDGDTSPFDSSATHPTSTAVETHLDSSDDASQDDGAESDSSMEQWLAEAAAFDALRKKEEEASNRLRALLDAEFSDSDNDQDDARMPGGFSAQDSDKVQAVDIHRKMLDPANLAMMDSVLPKAPPPLVLGRSRGRAAYSDSSSDSTDTDEALDQYSSSEDGGDAYQEALTGHERASRPTTISEPDLTGVHAQPPLPPRPSQPFVAPEVNVPQVVPPSSGLPSSFDTPADASAGTAAGLPATANGVTRSLSLKAKGKMPERDAPTASESEVAEPQLQESESGSRRAGDFEEDTTSSRDLSEDENLPSGISAALAEEQNGAATQASLLRPSQRLASFSKQRLHTPGTTHSLSSSIRKSSLEPLFQPLSYGSSRPEVSNRLKGLFGQPLIAPSEKATSTAASSVVLNSPPFVPEADFDALSPSLGAVSSRRRSSSTKSDRLDDKETTDANPRPSWTRRTTDKSEDNSVLEQESSTVPFTRQKSIDRSSDDPPAASSAAMYASLPVSGITPEQKAAQEALAQIAQLTTSSSIRQDSLAALERLLARSTRPASMIPTSLSASRSSIQGPRQLKVDFGASSSQQQQSELETAQAQTDQFPDSDSSRLSRQGAISRGKPVSSRNSLAPVPPPITYRTTGSTRPMSFVNPRSSAAPLPRGRLPAITDATRHFPPVAPTPAPVPTPSWLAHIPSEEGNQLPLPLEPNRLPSGSSRAPSLRLQSNELDAGRGSNVGPSSPVKVAGSRVSAMISRFEPPSILPELRSEGLNASPKSSTSREEQGTRSSASTSLASALNTSSGVDPASTLAQTGATRPDPEVFRRFSGQPTPSGVSEGSDTAAHRRPPPRPPSGTNPFRQNPVISPDRKSVNPGQNMPRSASSMEDLAKQLDEAAASWSQRSFRNSVASQLPDEGRHNSHLSVPMASLRTVEAGQIDGPMPRSPRTLAMESLTRRESLNDGASTPPRLPPKSPIMTPEQILVAGSRNGLSASIAAAQAAAFARRDHHGGRSQYLADSGWVNSMRIREEGGDHYAKQPTVSGDALRPSRSDPMGLGIRQGSGSALPDNPSAQLSSRPVSGRPLPTLPPSVRQPTQRRDTGDVSSQLGSGSANNVSRRLPMPPPLPDRPRGRDWADAMYSPPLASAEDARRLPQSSSSRMSLTTPASSSTRTDMATRRDSSGRSGSSGSDSQMEDLQSTPRIQSSGEGASRLAEASTPTPLTPEPAAASTEDPVTSASSSDAVPSQAGPRREGSLGITDFDLLVAQLERDGAHFEQLCAIGEFLGPAKRTSATAEELANLSVAKIECDSRRVTKEGKIKQKLSCVGVRVDKCAICLNQFKQDQMAVILPCSHIFHEGCARQLFQQRTTCPTCRRDAFES